MLFIQSSFTCPGPFPPFGCGLQCVKACDPHASNEDFQACIDYCKELNCKEKYVVKDEITSAYIVF